MGALQHQPDRLNNAIGIGQNIVVPESNDTKAVFRQFSAARCVRLPAPVMLAAIEFNGKVVRPTNKIDDVFADRVLPAKLVLRKLFPQRQP